MSRTRFSQNMPWLAAAVVGAIVAVLLLGAKLTERTPVDAAHPAPAAVPNTAQPTASQAPLSSDAETALAYVRAFQEGDCETVIFLTDWMQKRLEWARTHVGGPTAEGAARQELCEHIASRDDAGNRLRREGIEDRYVFTPDAHVEVLAMDQGRSDLSETTTHRVWLRVRYATPDGAPRDEAGRAISSLVAGLNLSADGRVLKAGIVGTLELDEKSVSHDWNLR